MSNIDNQINDFFFSNYTNIKNIGDIDYEVLYMFVHNSMSKSYVKDKIIRCCRITNNKQIIKKHKQSIKNLFRLLMSEREGGAYLDFILSDYVDDKVQEMISSMELDTECKILDDIKIDVPAIELEKYENFRKNINE